MTLRIVDNESHAGHDDANSSVIMQLNVLVTLVMVRILLERSEALRAALIVRIVGEIE